MSDPAIKCITFSDMVSLVERRGRIVGDVKPMDRDLIKGYINEYYMQICNLRKWQWRNFDRSFVMRPSYNSEDVTPTPPTASVIQYNRIVTLTGLTIDKSYMTRSIRFNNDPEMYRIIGVKVSTNQIYLETDYANDTNATSSFRIYQYEFALPPDCDAPNQLYIMRDSYTPEGELEFKNLLEFNRMISSYSSMTTKPAYYTIDGRTYANLFLRPLDQMLLDWDFLGGEDTDKVERLRMYPIDVDSPWVIHMSYSIAAKEMENDDDEPLLPRDYRWILVHYALYEIFKNNGQQITAAKEKKDAEDILNIMANDFRKTQTKPHFMVDARGSHREHIYGRGKRLLNISGSGLM